MATGIREDGSPVLGWEAGKQGREEEEEEKGWGQVLPTIAEDVLKRCRKVEIPELPPKLAVEVVQMGMDGLEGWGRAEPDFSSR